MPSLEIISVNIWNIIISLCNLLILFLIFKKFLFKPVKRVLKERQDQIDGKYAAAEDALKEADESRGQWETRLANAQNEADELMKNASSAADRKQGRIISEAKNKAELILHQAKNEAELQKKKAESEIKSEIVDISAQLAEKMLERGINTEDHRGLIDSFIEELGEQDDTDK